MTRKPFPIAGLLLAIGLWSCAAPTSHIDKEGIAPEAATGFRHIKPSHAKRFMVATANPHATRAGLAMLRRGGSAIDATIAAQLVLTLTEPHASGIGGGAFLLHYSPVDKKLRAFDGREMAPAAATEALFQAPDGKPLPFMKAVVGGRSVGAPGLLRMLELTHRQHGSLPWAALFGPAITLSEKGFAMSPRLHKLLGIYRHAGASAEGRAYFYKPDGTPKPIGAILKNPKLAQTLRLIAKGGANAFYTGPIAADIVRTVRQHPDNPGLLSHADLAGYVAKERKPICRPYRKYRVCGMSPPTSGGITVLQILGILSHFDLSAHTPLSAEAIHLFAEAARLAYADRALYIADSDFVDIPVAGLLHPAYLKSRAALIKRDKSLGTAKAGTVGSTQSRWSPDESLELPSTSHLSVVDAKGNIVSMTTSIEFAFGSGLMVRGFLLNNQLTDFSFVGSRNGRPIANRVQPGKRPRSSMSPTVVFDRKTRTPTLVIGSPGGSRIINYVAHALVAILDHGLNVQQALSLPHVVNRNGATELEAHPGWGDRLRHAQQKLGAWGHRLKVRDLNSGLHAIAITPKGLQGGADSRREGVAAGD